MRATVFLLCCCSVVWCQQTSHFVGGAVGVTKLSADGKTVISQSGSNVSLYKPENGFTGHVVAGAHLTAFFSIQGNYTVSANSLALISLSTTGGESVYEQSRSSRHDLNGGDAMLYFRNRASAFRPYLSTGAGVSHFRSKPERVNVLKGALVPPTEFSANKLFLRVAVGIDVRMQKGWYFRYAFSESIQKNPISVQLVPPR